MCSVLCSLLSYSAFFSQMERILFAQRDHSVLCALCLFLSPSLLLHLCVLCSLCSVLSALFLACQPQIERILFAQREHILLSMREQSGSSCALPVFPLSSSVFPLSSCVSLRVSALPAPMPLPRGARRLCIYTRAELKHAIALTKPVIYICMQN